jgi:2-polyprenyl-3-methyl-5-hydroxy-6-metoxy-1,4-benzoquinol methylase
MAFPINFARRLAPLRGRVDTAIDVIRYEIDTFPWTYHPTSDTKTGARRLHGTVSRWERMRDFLATSDVQTAIDVGCNGGWFVVRLAQMGLPVLGIDSDARFSRILLFEASRSKLDIAVLTMRVDLKTVALVPSADCIVFLSVWHHVVKEGGIDYATDLLRELWTRARHVLFFDTGESEMPPEFRLPDMVPCPQEWIARYLATVCAGGVVHHLGRHAAFAPDGTPAQRSLFAVTRQAMNSHEAA